MKFVEISIPYPPSVNKMYYNRRDNKNTLPGRGLTSHAKNYKKYIASLIHSTFPKIKYGKQDIKITIFSTPPNKRGDNHNGIKIVCDAIELSGIIENDKQIVALEIIPTEIKNPPGWHLKIEPYTENHKFFDKIKYSNIKNDFNSLMSILLRKILSYE